MISSLWHTDTYSELRRSKAINDVNDRILVYSKYSMISLGTESLVLRKRIPKSMHKDMRVPYMQGSFELPILYGYALCGLLKNNEKVHLMHPHQSQCMVHPESVFNDCQELPLHRIPLISNMETVINAIWDSKLDKDKEIIICGFGNIGSLLAITLKHHYHINVSIVESNNWRLKKAKELGFEIYENNSGFDIAFNTTANPSALQFCIDEGNEEATIIELSWYGNLPSNLLLGNNFHKNRLRIIGSQVSKIPIDKCKEFDYLKRKQLAADILKNDVFDKLITTVIPFEDTPEFFNSFRNNKIADGLIYLIKY